MDIGARTSLHGKIKAVVHGAVNSEVSLGPLGGQKIVPVITRLPAEALGLPVGQEVLAVAKTSRVMIAAE